MKTAKTIKKLREEKGYTQTEFADKYNLNLRTLQNWESGRTEPPAYVLEMLDRRIREDFMDSFESDIITKTYEYGKGFYIDIVDKGDLVNIYLYHEDYGVKAFMFGFERKDFNTDEELKDIIKRNIDEQIDFYIEDYISDNSDNCTMMDIYERTLKNCMFYEEENKKDSLLNEIGVLRGVVYCLESVVGCMPDNELKDHFIEIQNQLLNH